MAAALTWSLPPRTRPSSVPPLALLTALSTPAFWTRAAHAQVTEHAPAPSARGVATGQIVGAVTGEPLPGAVVVLARA